MVLIVLLAVAAIAAIEVTDEVLSEGADIRQRRAIELAVVLMAASFCLGIALG